MRWHLRIIRPKGETDCGTAGFARRSSVWRAFLWRAVEGKDFSVEDLASLLVGEYGIDRELALKDSATAASIWIEAGLVEE